MKSKLVEADLEKTSSDRGIVDLPQADVDDGNYTLISELPGYNLDTKNNFALEGGKTKLVVIKLVKI